MNAVEIEEAISRLAEQPFDPVEFPYAFLQAFGNKETTLKRLRKGESNKSDLGGVLQTNNIHIGIAAPGAVTNTLASLKASPATTRAKAKFVLATDGDTFEAEDLASGETVACRYADFPDHFGFFLPLAGITTVKQVRDSSFDIRATSRLNRLYVELLKDNPAWGTAERRPDMNHFMARLIFCFFAEDTDIFSKPLLFTSTVEQMSQKDSSNTHEVIGTLFRAMNMREAARKAADIPRWADQFPYVNGGLFSGSMDVPRFSRIARSYLLHIGALDWKKINPDIFGSMIQAVADDEERGALGMHYTSVPNILKVLNPLFLDDLHARLDEAGDNPRMLLNLRKRMSRIRVFDPACGSGNFLVIAYKQMRQIEAEINKRRGEADRRSEIPLTNFRGIELRSFPAEIARLALIIAEYQCDVLYRGQKEALRDFLPLDAENWITCGNALRLDWLSICPPTGTGVKHQAEDLFHTPLDQAQIDFENEGGETYICGNPPYRGSQWQTDEQKSDLKANFEGRTTNWKSLDYVAGWFMKAADYGTATPTVAALVSTNSICQGRQVETLWSLIFETGHEIVFAHTSFKWANLASHNAGVTVAIVGISNHAGRTRLLFSQTGSNGTTVKEVENINAYLVPGPNVIVGTLSRPLNGLSDMSFGNMPNDGGYLLLDADEAATAIKDHAVLPKYVRPFIGSQEFVRGIERRCIWVAGNEYEAANANAWLKERFEGVRAQRSGSGRATTNALAVTPYRFGEVRQTGNETIIAVAAISSENRDYLPCGLLPPGTIISNKCYALYDAPLWNLALIASRLHWIWIGTVCVRMRTDFSYSNTLGWNTFPVPTLTEKNKTDLTRCAEDILLAREAHFPATIADLYDPVKMPADLRGAHERNDEVLERIYIGRRFRNDTERLEKLFELYTKMTATPSKPPHCQEGGESMSGYALFQMWGPFRQSLIQGHLFYVEQARKRLLSQFDDIESDANRAAEEWLEQSGQHFDPDRHDPGDFYEAANDRRIEFYGLLSDMREQTRLSVVAGMFHEWDKQLRDWLAREIQHWHRGDNATLKIWSADFAQIAELLESFGWNVRSADYFRTLDACRLVVNVYKHGEGKSLDALRSSFPQYLDDPFNGSGSAFSDTKYRDHTHLKVNDHQFQAFSDAILAFWRDVPENVCGSQMTAVPEWFGKAIMKDRANPQQASQK